ncbi:TRAP transporter small permease [Rhodospirillum sp. A1_3_36]|uniref:TRAP transporter small permease n=1 Tax=Rhodospirillum sp. A1_3_36 TaxID=3391666 RepID=UPI0039A5A5B7
MSTTLSGLRLLDRGLWRLETFVVILGTGAMTVILISQVVMRYLVGAPLFWAEEAATHLMAYTTLFGLSLLTRGGRLVGVDALVLLLPSRARDGIALVLLLVMFVLAVLFTVIGVDWLALPATRSEMSATLDMPRWYTYAAVPAAFACMAVHLLMDILEMRTGQAPPVRHEGVASE